MNIPPDSPLGRRCLELAGVKPKGTPFRGVPRNGSSGWAVEFTVNVRPANESNRHDGLRAKLARKAAVKAAVAAALPPLLPPPPVRVTLTRLGGVRRMDADNLARSMKVIVDEVCRAVGVDDGDRANVRLRWRQRAAYGAARVLVRVEGA